MAPPAWARSRRSRPRSRGGAARPGPGRPQRRRRRAAPTADLARLFAGAAGRPRRRARGACGRRPRRRRRAHPRGGLERPQPAAGWTRTPPPRRWSASARSSPPPDAGAGRRQAVAIGLCTSGSSGLPKVVELDWQGLLLNAGSFARAARYGEGDVVWCTTPLAHLYCFGAAVLGGLLSGATVLLTGSALGPGEFGRLAGRAPARLPALGALPLPALPGGSCARTRSWPAPGAPPSCIAAGEPVPPELVESWREVAGSGLRAHYGLTEGGQITLASGAAGEGVGRPLARRRGGGRRGRRDQGAAAGAPGQRLPDHRPGARPRRLVRDRRPRPPRRRRQPARDRARRPPPQRRRQEGRPGRDRGAPARLRRGRGLRRRRHRGPGRESG